MAVLDRVNLDYLRSELNLSLDIDGVEVLLGLCNKDFDVIVATRRKDLAVVRILNHCQKHGWLPELCQAVIDKPGFADDLVRACELCLAQWNERSANPPAAATGARADALHLFNEKPFADRSGQRADLAHLLGFNGERVYIVRGEKASGKTHLATFVSYLAEGLAGVSEVYLDLGKMSGDLIGPRDVMMALTSRMGLDTTSLTADHMAQEVRQSEKLCDWFVGCSRSFGDQWVIQIDGVSDPRVSPGALDLVDRLVLAAARRDLRRAVLVVLALRTPVHPEVKNDVKECNLLHLTAGDIRVYIDDYARIKAKSLGPGVLDAIEQAVLEGLSLPYGHHELDTIRTRLQTVLPKALGVSHACP